MNKGGSSDARTCDVLFIGCGLRTTTLLTSSPEVLEYNIMIVDGAPSVGPGSLIDWNVDSNSFGSKFFQFIQEDGVFGELLRHPEIAPLAAQDDRVPLADVGRGLLSLGNAISSIVGSQNVITGRRVQRLEFRTSDEAPFVAFLTDESTVRSRIVVVATGRKELIIPELRRWRKKIRLSGDVLLSRNQSIIVDWLRSVQDGRIGIIGGSHSAFSALEVLLRYLRWIEVHDSTYRRPTLVLAHRNPICLHYNSVEQAVRDQVPGREMIFDPDNDVCPKTGAVFRDSGLRYTAKLLYCKIWSGQLPHCRLERFSSIEANVPEMDRFDGIVQALGYRSRVFPLSLDGRELWKGDGEDIVSVADDGEVLFPGKGVPPNFHLFGLRLVQTLKQKRDNNDEEKDQYQRLTESLQRLFDLQGYSRVRELPTRSAR